MGGLQSTERSLSATASKGLSALRAVTDLCCAVNQRLTSVVRETRTLRSVGAGGFGPRRPGGGGEIPLLYSTNSVAAPAGCDGLSKCNIQGLLTIPFAGAIVLPGDGSCLLRGEWNDSSAPAALPPFVNHREENQRKQRGRQHSAHQRCRDPFHDVATQPLAGHDR